MSQPRLLEPDHVSRPALKMSKLLARAQNPGARAARPQVRGPLARVTPRNRWPRHMSVFESGTFAPRNARSCSKAFAAMACYHGDMSEYTAIMKASGEWWIGWIEEVPGVNCQERTREELLESLRITLGEALDLNRAEARSAAGTDFEEAHIAV